MTEPEIPAEIKKQLLLQEIQTYQNTKYLMEIRYRVNKKLDNKEALKATEEELIRIEKALDELNLILEELS